MQSCRLNTGRLPQASCYKVLKTPVSIQTTKMPFFPHFGAELRPLFRLVEDYDKFARELTKGGFPDVASFTPKCDVQESSEAYSILAEVPGIPQENISIEWTDLNTLAISGSSKPKESSEAPTTAAPAPEAPAVESPTHQATVEDDADDFEKVESSSVAADDEKVTKSEPEPQPKKTVQESKTLHSERPHGSFRRTFTFPARIEHDEVKAKLNNGILEVTVPKLRRDLQKTTIRIE